MAWIAAGIALALQPNSATAGSVPASHTDQAPWIGETGVASYYGAAHHGRRTAWGTIFDQNAMTAAHPWLPFGTRIRVTHVASGRSIVVVVTDRLYSNRRVIDLSAGAARELRMLQQGVAEVTIVPV